MPQVFPGAWRAEFCAGKMPEEIVRSLRRFCTEGHIRETLRSRSILCNDLGCFCISAGREEDIPQSHTDGVYQLRIGGGSLAQNEEKHGQTTRGRLASYQIGQNTCIHRIE